MTRLVEVKKIDHRKTEFDDLKDVFDNKIGEVGGKVFITDETEKVVMNKTIVPSALLAEKIEESKNGTLYECQRTSGKFLIDNQDTELPDKIRYSKKLRDLEIPDDPPAPPPTPSTTWPLTR